jgi:hypothetical protein
MGSDLSPGWYLVSDLLADEAKEASETGELREGADREVALDWLRGPVI